MSHYEYEISKHVAMQEYPFGSLIMAAFTEAAGPQLVALANAFPELYNEFEQRERARHGFLPTEVRR